MLTEKVRKEEEEEHIYHRKTQLSTPKSCCPTFLALQLNKAFFCFEVGKGNILYDVLGCRFGYFITVGIDDFLFFGFGSGDHLFIILKRSISGLCSFNAL